MIDIVIQEQPVIRRSQEEKRADKEQRRAERRALKAILMLDPEYRAAVEQRKMELAARKLERAIEKELRKAVKRNQDSETTDDKHTEEYETFDPEYKAMVEKRKTERAARKLTHATKKELRKATKRNKRSELTDNKHVKGYKTFDVEYETETANAKKENKQAEATARKIEHSIKNVINSIIGQKRKKAKAKRRQERISRSLPKRKKYGYYDFIFGAPAEPGDKFVDHVEWINQHDPKRHDLVREDSCNVPAKKIKRRYLVDPHRSYRRFNHCKGDTSYWGSLRRDFYSTYIFSRLAKEIDDETAQFEEECSKKYVSPIHHPVRDNIREDAKRQVFIFDNFCLNHCRAEHGYCELYEATTNMVNSMDFVEDIKES